MNKKRKIVLLIGGGIIGLTLLFLLGTYIINNQYRNRIPEVPDTSSVSTAVKEQIAEAYQKAYRDPSAQNLGELGMAFHSSANYNQAAQCYQLAIKKNKSDWKWNYYLGYLRKELGESDKVIENFNRVIELNPDADLAWYYLGEAYRNNRKNDLAEKAFSKITNKTHIPGGNGTARNDDFPLSIYGLFQLSKIYIETGRLNLAEETIRKLLRQNDVFGPAYRLLGNISTKKGNVSLGNEYNVRANDLLPFYPPADPLIDKLALMSRSELFLLKKIDESAYTTNAGQTLILVDQGLTYMADNKYFLSKAIEIYLANEMNHKAVELTERHIHYFIDDYPELSATGNLFFQKGLYNEAIKYLAIALELKSDDVDIYKNRALCYWRTGDKQKTEEVLTEAAEKNKDNPENLADVVFAFLQFKNRKKANEYLGYLHQLSQNNPKVQKVYAKIAENNGNLMEAISKYESSFKGNPKDDETMHFLGELLIYNGMWSKYIEFLKEALKHNPNDPQLLEKLSTVLVNCPDESLRNFDDGIKYSIRAFTNKDSSLSVVLSSGKNLAIALVTKGDKQNALSILEKTINISRRTNVSEDIKQELDQLYRAIQKL